MFREVIRLLARPGVLAALPFVIGACLLAFDPPSRHDISCRGPLPGGGARPHLARCDQGASVRVSTSDVEHGHHPIFLIDGRIGSPIEKWASFPGDRRPWVEVRWAAPRAARRVVLHHAGVREAPELSTVDFDVRVRADGAWRTIAEVRGNRDARTLHEVNATAIDRLRVEIVRPNLAGDKRAHLYEVEVQGD